MEYQSLKLLLNCIIRSDISFTCLGTIVSFIYRHLFPCYLIKETIFFIILIWNTWHLKCSEKCFSKFFHKFLLLRIYILKDSRPLLQKWACHVQKCKSTSYGITAPNVFLGEKIEICKTTNQISTDTYFLAKYVFFKNSKFQFGTFIKNQTHLYLFCNDIRFLYFFIMTTK